jgi:transcriptional regulator with XRE-family HTH domain
MVNLENIDWFLFGKIIKNKRLNLGLSVEEAAKYMGISRSRLYDIENGMVKFFIRRSNLQKIIKFCGIVGENIPLIQNEGNPTSYDLDDITKKILQILFDMTDEEKRKFLQDLEDCQLLKEIKKKKIFHPPQR